MMCGARPRGLALLAALACAACSGTSVGTGDADGGADPTVPEGARPSLTFGETSTSVSASAAAMMQLSPANPDPTTLAGLYERTGYGSDDRPSDYLIITNKWRVRVEIREAAIAAAIECNIEVGGATTASKRVTAYGSSPIEVHPWGIRIVKAVSKSETWSEYGVQCSLDLPDEDWPYCLGTEIPKGYSSCVYMQGGLLSSRSIDGARREVGKKIRN